ncbi:YlbF family regulator [Clostridium botulinum]|uniref:UPF0342 protein Z955_01645 n=1 Tax=Clostridium botulinum C/D str. DC5 TaxID=1443128 RepID=A0A0A0IKZ2_CLOBO|nr:YlbF family regulator [Clostridium botulinum]KEI01504.1 hypothetical protein Z952_11640 [Clostridium botulinum C/D str. BKT75002]KEI07838.1 hypothetical protein Z954_02775 [Clostridium botulinum C/D str. BKT2873]KGM94873.1 hypothetical protein Z956_06325 [Clostridium botulinum D str. CCUG 7971]KGN01264.1 hypothetical protein Z955_01645 [Clostridium botulinum C/D str. DC5]KOC49559.1 hypothetical protein ADU88_05205 [Clostridium botulinum]
MNIYDKVHELANELKNCEEVKNFKKAKKGLEGKDASKRMVEDFRKVQMQAYSEQMENGKPSKETLEKLEKLGSIMSMDMDVSNYMEAEVKFGVLWEDIIKILGKAVDDDFDKTK